MVYLCFKSWKPRSTKNLNDLQIYIVLVQLYNHVCKLGHRPTGLDYLVAFKTHFHKTKWPWLCTMECNTKHSSIRVKFEMFFVMHNSYGEEYCFIEESFRGENIEI